MALSCLESKGIAINPTNILMLTVNTKIQPLSSFKGEQCRKTTSIRESTSSLHAFYKKTFKNDTMYDYFAHSLVCMSHLAPLCHLMT